MKLLYNYDEDNSRNISPTDLTHNSFQTVDKKMKVLKILLVLLLLNKMSHSRAICGGHNSTHYSQNVVG